MKIVMRYELYNTCCSTIEYNIPIEYESIEAAIRDFKNVFNDAKLKISDKDKDPRFTFCGNRFYVSYFAEYFNYSSINFPEFLSLEDWFEKYKST